jgi:hypothetical protein
MPLLGCFAGLTDSLHELHTGWQVAPNAAPCSECNESGQAPIR